MAHWLFQGDCLVVMSGAADATVDAIITDPPYGLSFMGKKWDYKIPSVEVFAEMFRVLKPGGRLLCFAGTRTFHRMWCNIEDAGFTIEDTVAWMYGSGFPKHASKLKPAFEPICVARKGGTSELNIEAARIATTAEDVAVQRARTGGVMGAHNDFGGRRRQPAGNESGRWPANVVLDEEAAALLDAQSGISKSTGGRNANISKTSVVYGGGKGLGQSLSPEEVRGDPGFGDTGGASRFFYCAKASRSEREAGLEDVPKQKGGSNAAGFTEDVAGGLDRNRPVGNHHPTVKPVSLMRWLTRLITQPGDTVLDPFCGSGTTGIAAALEGRDFIGIDLDAAYLDIARRRIEHWRTHGEK